MLFHIGLLLGLVAQWSIYYKVGPVTCQWFSFSGRWVSLTGHCVQSACMDYDMDRTCCWLGFYF